MAKKIRWELVFLIIFSIIFLAILFFSVSLRDVTVDYYFKDNISIDKDKIVNRQKLPGEYELGHIDIKNDGFIPARVKLKSYILCSFDTQDYTYDYYLFYRGNIEQSYNEMFSASGSYVDVGSRKSEKLYIYLQSFYIEEFNNIKNNETLTEDFNIYVYEIESQDMYRYDFCRNADKNAYEKVIKVIINEE